MTIPTPSKTESAYDIVMERRPVLDVMLAPKTVALIGATESPGSVGRTLMENLTNKAFQGEVYPVNPKRESILGVPAYPSIAKVPGPVDLAVICTPAATVPGRDHRMHRGRDQGRDHHFRRIQGDRRQGRGAGATDFGTRAQRQDENHRPELSRRHDSARRTECDLRQADGPSRQRRLYQPERRALRGGARLEPQSRRRLQRVYFHRLDARCRLGRSHLPPGRRSEYAQHRRLYGDDRRRAGVSLRRAGSFPDQADYRAQGGTDGGRPRRRRLRIPDRSPAATKCSKRPFAGSAFCGSTPLPIFSTWRRSWASSPGRADRAWPS